VNQAIAQKAEISRQRLIEWIDCNIPDIANQLNEMTTENHIDLKTIRTLHTRTYQSLSVDTLDRNELKDICTLLRMRSIGTRSMLANSILKRSENIKLEDKVR
jgi:PHP family Zn ribbon phosphoesterase